jgi:aspartyl-tRNA synthetase
MVNKDMETGEIEVRADELRILNRSKTPPFVIEDEAQALEDLRFKYRYLDLRTQVLKENIVLRHRAMTAAREYLNSKGLLEIETPMLVKRTPEGARDFLVPSRLNPGKFYALPQSPQLYKQILMVSGFDKYFQFAKCMRDEDLRADRQPEHTQIDIEMSFVHEDDVFSLVEGMMKHTIKETIGLDVDIPFPRMTYAESMAKYGTDKPDLRFDLEIKEITELIGRSTSDMLKKAASAGGAFGLGYDEGTAVSRKNIEQLEQVAKKAGAAGLAWGKIAPDGKTSGMMRFFDDDSMSELKTVFETGDDALFLMVAGDRSVSLKALGAVRLALAGMRGLVRKGEHKLLWITEFPVFEWDKDTDSWAPAHHMFTMPMDEDLDLLEADPDKVRGRLYDLAYNGVEMGSGSIRNHVRSIQERVMQVVGIDKKEAARRFGFLLDALEYGAPPHGGIALGFDRIVMVLSGRDNIREFIAFPKTTTGASPMDDCPSPVEDSDLRELYIKLDLPKKEA